MRHPRNVYSNVDLIPQLVLVANEDLGTGMNGEGLDPSHPTAPGCTTDLWKNCHVRPAPKEDG